jgi:hypothetical protein
MKISQTEHDAILKAIKEFSDKLDEMGVSTGIVSINCDIEDIGWLPSHFSFGDPMAQDGLAWDFLHTGDDDDDDIVFGFIEPDAGGDADGEEWKG